MDFLAVVIVLLIIAVFAALEEDEEPDPLDLARPSIEHLHAEAQRAAEELRQLDRHEGQ
jgi:hypothetical protein